jgi:hypothetical protein
MVSAPARLSKRSEEKSNAYYVMKSNATVPEAAEDVCPTFEFECTANTQGGWLRSWCLNSRQDLYDHKYGSVGRSGSRSRLPNGRLGNLKCNAYRT